MRSTSLVPARRSDPTLCLEAQNAILLSAGSLLSRDAALRYARHEMLCLVRRGPTMIQLHILVGEALRKSTKSWACFKDAAVAIIERLRGSCRMANRELCRRIDGTGDDRQLKMSPRMQRKRLNRAMRSCAISSEAGSHKPQLRTPPSLLNSIDVLTATNLMLTANLAWHSCCLSY